MPATALIRTPAYRRREPEKEPLYQILSGHLETFLQQAQTSEHQLPLHVEKEMRAYLECGILAYGFVRARCEDCGAGRAVAFSARSRVLPFLLRAGAWPSRRRTAIRALRPAPIAWGGRPCWRGCFPPTSAHARPVAGA